MIGRFVLKPVAAALLAGASAPLAHAQQPAPPPPVSMVGQVAPDFTLPSVSKDGGPVRPFTLSDYKGQTVVLFFFPKARTKG